MKDDFAYNTRTFDTACKWVFWISIIATGLLILFGVERG